MASCQSPHVAAVVVHEDDLGLPLHGHHEGDLFPVRRPGGRGIHAGTIGEPLRALPLRIDQVQVRISPEIGRVRNLLSVGRPHGRKIDGPVVGDLLRVSAVEISDEDLFALALKPG